MVQILSQYVSRKSLLLAPAEAMLIPLALVSGLKLRFWNDPDAFVFYTMLPDFAVQALAVMFCFQISFYYNELYDWHSISKPSEEVARLGRGLGGGCLLLSLFYLLFPSLVIGRGVFLIALLVLVGSLTLVRVSLDLAWRNTAPRERVLVVGTGKLATGIAREMTQRDDLRLRLVGYVDTQQPGASGMRDLFGRPVIGNTDELEVLVAARRISRIMVAVEDQPSKQLIGKLLRLRTRGLGVDDAHSALAALTGRIPLETVASNWFVFSEGFCRTRSTVAMKRAVDLIVSCAGLVLSAPIMALVAVAVKLDSRGPALYRQTRVGKGGRCFELLKFRSMRSDAEAQHGPQWAAQNDPRVTRVGRYLRKCRLDELPQFINVIRGEMSFTGPRPERPEFVERLQKLIPYYDERHTVRPGITGWAQVRYPYGASVEDALRKLEYDLFYLKNMSVLFDCVILVETVKIVLFGRGAR